MYSIVKSIIRPASWHGLSAYVHRGNVTLSSFAAFKSVLVRFYGKKSLKKYKVNRAEEEEEDDDDNNGKGRGEGEAAEEEADVQGAGNSVDRSRHRKRERDTNTQPSSHTVATSSASLYHLVSSPKTMDDYDFDAVHQDMEKSFKAGQMEFVQAFQWTLGHFTPNMLDSIMVLDDSTTVGVTMKRPLSSLASIHAKDAQTLALRSHDPLYVKAIEKALRSVASSSPVPESSLTFHRESDSVLLVALPKLDASMRAQLAKHGAKYFESMKCKIRDTRRDALAHLDTIAADDRLKIRKKVQSIHDAFIKKIDDFAEIKKKEWQQKR